MQKAVLFCLKDSERMKQNKGAAPVFRFAEDGLSFLYCADGHA